MTQGRTERILLLRMEESGAVRGSHHSPNTSKIPRHRSFPCSATAVLPNCHHIPSIDVTAAALCSAHPKKALGCQRENFPHFRKRRRFKAFTPGEQLFPCGNGDGRSEAPTRLGRPAHIRAGKELLCLHGVLIRQHRSLSEHAWFVTCSAPDSPG